MAGTSQIQPITTEEEVEGGDESNEGEKDDIAYHLNCILKRMEKIDQANQRKNAQYKEMYDLVETEEEIMLKQLNMIEDLKEMVVVK